MPSKYRVSPPKVFPEVAHASRPPNAMARVADTFRQTGFVLEADVSAIIEGLGVEAQLAEGATGSRFRNQKVASGLAYWSRSWLCRLQAMHAVEWGNYMAAFPLIRSAADYQSAQLALLRTDAAEWEEWIATEPAGIAPAQHAVEFRQYAFRSAEVMATHPRIGPVYRAATELALPHFGSTLLLAGSESDANRIAMTFGDRDFHIGLAELATGMIASLGAAQVSAILEFAESCGVQDAAPADQAITQLERIADDPRRCRMQPEDVDGLQRFIISNWRRNPGGAPQRVLL